MTIGNVRSSALRPLLKNGNTAVNANQGEYGRQLQFDHRIDHQIDIWPHFIGVCVCVISFSMKATKKKMGDK